MTKASCPRLMQLYRTKICFLACHSSGSVEWEPSSISYESVKTFWKLKTSLIFNYPRHRSTITSSKWVKIMTISWGSDFSRTLLKIRQKIIIFFSFIKLIHSQVLCNMFSDVLELKSSLNLLDKQICIREVVPHLSSLHPLLHPWIIQNKPMILS